VATDPALLLNVKGGEETNDPLLEAVAEPKGEWTFGIGGKSAPFDSMIFVLLQVDTTDVERNIAGVDELLVPRAGKRYASNEIWKSSFGPESNVGEGVNKSSILAINGWRVAAVVVGV
jgi:hypothetical protein